MLGEIAQHIVLNLVIAFILGLFIGFFLGRGKKEKFKEIKKSTDSNTTGFNKNRFRMNPVFNKSASLDYKPLVLSSSSKKDNLQKITGIDEDIQNALYKLGIYQFGQISKWSNKNIEWVENFLNLPGYIKINQWIEQSKILKTGRETNYSQKLLDEECNFNKDLENKEDI